MRQALDPHKTQAVSDIVVTMVKAYGSQRRLTEEINKVLEPHDTYTRQAIVRWISGKMLPGYWQLRHIVTTTEPGNALHTGAKQILRILRPDIW